MWGTAAPNAEFGVTLWEDGQIEAEFRGADEVSEEEEDVHDDHGHGEGPDLHAITMTGLNKSQGGIAYVDGSAKQSSNADLQRSVNAMMKSNAGTTKFVAPFVTRPFMGEDHHDH